MGLETATLAAISAGTAAVGTVYSISQNQKARGEQKKIANIQAANNASAQMEERRAQVREERIKRARLLQQGEAAGTAGSSGELGSLGGLSTQLGSNIGSNLGRIGNANAISSAQQGVADARSNAQLGGFLTSAVSSGIDLSQNIFAPKPSASGDPLDYFYTN